MKIRKLKNEKWHGARYSTRTVALRCMKLNSPNNTGAFVEQCVQCTHWSYEVTRPVLYQCDALNLQRCYLLVADRCDAKDN